jgi:hypothetical protein
VLIVPFSIIFRRRKPENEPKKLFRIIGLSFWLKGIDIELIDKALLFPGGSI